MQFCRFLHQQIRFSRKFIYSLEIFFYSINCWRLFLWFNQTFFLDGDVTIPKNCAIIIMLLGLHRNPNHYPNPHRFNPDNFTPDRIKERHPYSFIPFSAGQRTCFGTYCLAPIRRLPTLYQQAFSSFCLCANQAEIIPKTLMRFAENH